LPLNLKTMTRREMTRKLMPVTRRMPRSEIAVDVVTPAVVDTEVLVVTEVTEADMEVTEMESVDTEVEPVVTEVTEADMEVTEEDADADVATTDAATPTTATTATNTKSATITPTMFATNTVTTSTTTTTITAVTLTVTNTADVDADVAEDTEEPEELVNQLLLPQNLQSSSSTHQRFLQLSLKMILTLMPMMNTGVSGCMSCLGLFFFIRMD
jgi:hypothetical protein